MVVGKEKGYPLSYFVICYWLLVICCLLFVIGCWLFVIGCWLFIVYWLFGHCPSTSLRDRGSRSAVQATKNKKRPLEDAFFSNL